MLNPDDNGAIIDLEAERALGEQKAALVALQTPPSSNEIEALQAELERLKLQEAERRRVAQLRHAERTRIQAEVDKRAKKRAGDLLAQYKAQQTADLERAAERLAREQLNYELDRPDNPELAAATRPAVRLTAQYITRTSQRGQ